jgi:4-cresol dehydrogenase (hydroxylating)
MADLVPPGVSPADFARALAGFRAAVGAEWVFAQGDDLASYLDPFDISPEAEHAASAAVAPGDTDALRAVLAVANRYRVPLWPVSMGKNFAYGTAAPRQRGTVVLDLKRMNRVLEIDERLGYAVVEPGVSFFEMKAELDRRQSKLWMSGAAHSAGTWRRLHALWHACRGDLRHGSDAGRRQPGAHRPRRDRRIARVEPV